MEANKSKQNDRDRKVSTKSEEIAKSMQNNLPTRKTGNNLNKTGSGSKTIKFLKRTLSCTDVM